MTSVNSYGQNYQFQDYLEVADLSNGSSLSIVDPEGNDPTTVNGHLAYAIESRTVYVRLVYGRGDRKDILGSTWTYQVEFEIEDLDNGNIEVDTLEINRNNSSAVYEELKKYDDFSPKAELRVINVIGTGDYADLEDVRLELVMDVGRYDYFDDTQITSLFVTHNSDNHEARCVWQELDGALAYDLEWVYIDDQNNGALPATDAELFRDAGRVRLNQNWYNLDLIYPSGTVYFRVRGVGRYIEEVDGDYSYWKPGEWTASTQNTSIDLLQDFEESRNWSYSIVFAENGKSKQAMSYFDEGLKVRQSQTNLSTDDVTLVGEQFYDVEGRSTLSILPAPLDDEMELSHPANSLFYHEKADGRLNVNQLNQGYSRADYDKTTHADPLGTSSGAARYFSPNNTSNTIHRDFIPDANGYVFTQTKYKRDGTGRPSEQSGIGEQFQLGSDHSVKYYYSGVAQMELQRLFVHNVGDASHYKKVITKDANGQLSASYIGMGGQTIATALIGEAPSNVQDIPAPAVPIYRNLMTHNAIDENQWKSIASDEIINTIPNTNHTFSYDLTGVLYNYNQTRNEYNPVTGHLEPTNDNICRDCEYELHFKLIDPNGIEIDLAPYLNNQTLPYHIEPDHGQVDNCNNNSYTITQALITDANNGTV
jgi:hypothetical protein